MATEDRNDAASPGAEPAPERDPARNGTGSAGASSGPATTDTGGQPVPMTQVVGRVVLVALAVLFGIFAVANSQPVDFSWVFGETSVVKQGDEVVRGGVPLIILLVVSFLLGGLLGRASTWRRTRRLEREARGRRGGDGR